MCAYGLILFSFTLVFGCVLRFATHPPAKAGWLVLCGAEPCINLPSMVKSVSWMFEWSGHAKLESLHGTMP